jgi:hypothetical protein
MGSVAICLIKRRNFGLRSNVSELLSSAVNFRTPVMIGGGIKPPPHHLGNRCQIFRENREITDIRMHFLTYNRGTRLVTSYCWLKNDVFCRRGPDRVET